MGSLKRSDLLLNLTEFSMFLKVGHLGEAYEEWVHQPIVSKDGPRFFENEILEVCLLTTDKTTTSKPGLIDAIDFI